MRLDTAEDRVKAIVEGILTVDEIALIQRELMKRGGEVLLTSDDRGKEVRYLPPAPCPVEQAARRRRALGRLQARRGCRRIIAYIEKRSIRFEEVLGGGD